MSNFQVALFYCFTLVTPKRILQQRLRFFSKLHSLLSQIFVSQFLALTLFSKKKLWVHTIVQYWNSALFRKMFCLKTVIEGKIILRQRQKLKYLDFNNKTHMIMFYVNITISLLYCARFKLLYLLNSQFLRFLAEIHITTCFLKNLFWDEFKNSKLFALYYRNIIKVWSLRCTQ